MAQLDRELPEFSLSPVYFRDNTEDCTGFEDIKFDDCPEFSQKYCLKGKDVYAVRQLFTPHVIHTLLRENLESNIEAKGNFIIICTLIKSVNPKDVPGFFQKAKIIVDLFI